MNVEHWRFEMSKTAKLGIAIVAVVVAVGTVLAVPSLVFAQGPADPDEPGTPVGPGGFWAHSGGQGWMAQYQDEMHAAIAEALGLSVDEFEAALDSGQTVWQIAEAQGVSVEALQETMQAAHADILAQAVADGVLTQEQADAILNHVGTGLMVGGGRGMRGGRGLRGGYDGGCPWDND